MWHMREQILSEIQRLAAANGGQPPGSRLFERETGIRQSAWRGVFWARWNEAVAEAGLQPNVATIGHDEQFVLGKIADSCRHYGKIPTAMEFRIYRKSHPDFPNDRAIARRFRTTA